MLCWRSSTTSDTVIPSESEEGGTANDLSQSRCLDFDLQAKVKRTHRHNGASRLCLAGPACINLVEARPVFDIRDIHTHLEQLPDTAASTFQRRLEIRQHLFGLDFERRVRELAALGVDRQLPRYEHETIARRDVTIVSAWRSETSGVRGVRHARVVFVTSHEGDSI